MDGWIGRQLIPFNFWRSKGLFSGQKNVSFRADQRVTLYSIPSMYGIFYLHFAIKKSTNINPASPSNRGLVSVVSVFTSLPSEDLFGGTSAVVSQPGSGWKVTSSAEIGSWWCALEQLNLRGGGDFGGNPPTPPKRKRCSFIHIIIRNQNQDSESLSGFRIRILIFIFNGIPPPHHQDSGSSSLFKLVGVWMKQSNQQIVLNFLLGQWIIF